MKYKTELNKTHKKQNCQLREPNQGSHTVISNNSMLCTKNTEILLCKKTYWCK